MLLWDVEWKPHQKRLSVLDRGQLVRLAVTSITKVSELGIEMEEPIRHEFSNAFEALRSGDSYSCDELEELIQQEVQPGVYDLSMAVVTLVRNMESIDDGIVLEALSYCYQAVLDREILSELDRNMTESEVNILEAKNENCKDCIRSQLELLESFYIDSETAG